MLKWISLIHLKLKPIQFVNTVEKYLFIFHIFNQLWWYYVDVT